MRSNKLFLGVLVGAGLLAAYWFLVLSPKREEATALKAQVASKQQEVSASEATLATYRQARDAYTSTYARVTSLGKAVPADDDVRSLVVQLEHAATSNKVNFRSISASASGSPSTAAQSGAATTLNPPPGAVATAAGFSTMPFNLTFTGNYAHLTDLFTELERFVAVQNEQIRVKGRLMRVDSITLTPRTNATTNELDAMVSASTFLVPAAEGVTGAGTTSTGTTPAAPGGTTTPTTTAAVTGAIE